MSSSVAAFSASNLLGLPFDQYGRYDLVRDALQAVRPALGANLRLLDVGGFFRNGRGTALLPARLFLPDDDVTVLDVQSADLPGYVQGDGRGLHFADASFDFVISCDTLEHIPAPDRPAFWQELLRVVRYGVILIAPFASPEVVAAEDLLFYYIKAELGVEQLQLKEHRGYGLPELPSTCALLDTLGLRYGVYPSGYVHAWLAMMIAKHYLLARSNDHDLHEQLDAYYTRFFSADERREPAYRHALLVERGAAHGWWDAANAALLQTLRTSPPDQQPAWADLAAWLLHLTNLRLGEQRSVPLLHTLAVQQQQLLEQQRMLAQRDAQIADLEQRARWLEGQAQMARNSLAAVERGRVLRLLRWLQARWKSALS